MLSLHRTLLISILLLVTLFIAACGSSSSSSTGSSGSSTPTVAATSTTTQQSTDDPYKKTATTPTSGTTATAQIHTATATVSGKTETILTNENGLTLYYFTADTKTTSACITGCTGTWPPLLTQGSAAPTSTGSLPDSLSVQASANGNQVQYNGHFLYTYAGDTAPGQTNGQGIGGKWFVATTMLAA